jgi:DNA topoisomerase-1
MRIRQRAIALYFIDKVNTKNSFLSFLITFFHLFLFKLALRVGNEKDEDEADTVGCCSLRVEHITLYDRIEGIGENIVEFDFLGKDSIR